MAKITRSAQTLPPPLEIHYRKDRSVYRVWRNDWAGDQFNVVEWNHLARIEYTCKLFGIPFVDKTGDDD